MEVKWNYPGNPIWPTDDELKQENKEARKNYTQKGIKNLACAVCMQAIRDYKNKHHPNDPEDSKDAYEARLCKQFFSDPLFKYFVRGMTADEVADTIDRIESVSKQETLGDARRKEQILPYIVKDEKGRIINYYSSIIHAKRCADKHKADLYEYGKKIYSSGAKYTLEGGSSCRSIHIPQGQ